MSRVFSPDHRSAVRTSLVDRARADPRIAGAALVGSSARDAEDAWSDIDLVLQLAPSADEAEVVQQWTAALDERFGVSDLLDVVSDGVRYRVFLLSSSLQVDVSFFPFDRFRATEPGFRLLFGEPNPATPPPPADAERAAGLGWLYALHARSAVARGRTWQAVLMLDDLRGTVVTLMCSRAGLDPWHGRGVDQLPRVDQDALSWSRAADLGHEELDRSRTALTGLLHAEIRSLDPDRGARLEPPFRDLAQAVLIPAAR